MDPETQRPFVASYYGETLKSSDDLKTSACCPIDSMSAKHREILEKVHPEVKTRFYGCGSPIPDNLSGRTVLDLGCGTGRDVYLTSALVGPTGRVIGVDMTDAQLDVARTHVQFHADAFFGEGTKPNTEFRKGFIEDLRSAGVEDDSVDVVISNCVCNLSPNKEAVFSEIARVLREGGELYFSDVYADRRLSPEAKAHPVLVAECLGGALYLEDFRRILNRVGLHDFRVVTCGPVDIHNEEMRALVPDVQFYSITVRAFKVSGLEDRREQYGEVAVYNGCRSLFKLDADYSFSKGIPTKVDSNTAAILRQSRFAGQFSVTERGVHTGLFDESEMIGSLRTSCNPTPTEPSSNGCCPPKQTKPASNGCCPPKEAKPATTGCCAPKEA